MDDLRSLLLNSAFEPLLILPWQRAITLFFAEKVEVVETYEVLARSPSIAVPIPAVVRLRQWLRWREPRVRFNRKNLFVRDEYRCQYCHLQLPGDVLTMDHVLPRSRGGPTSWENVVTSCARCNRRKGGRTPEEAGMPLRRCPRPPRALSAGRDGVLLAHAPLEWRAWLKAA